MRPIQKPDIGSIIDKTITIKETYKPYQTAKEPLIHSIGQYCSFCERPIPFVSLEVEHIQAKSIAKYKHLEFLWINFLLACKNCNLAKAAIDVIFDEIYLPHLNNTFLIFCIKEGGLITINPNIQDPDKIAKTQKLIDLLGLDRVAGHSKRTRADDRWQGRHKAWNLATRFLEKHQQQQTDVETIVELCKSDGFWSIWMTVFQNYPEVKKALITETIGTATNCFDHNFNAINRNGSEI
ncbi:MAG: hypothetical protein RLZZ292_3499 [Bacteroidota bacterium]|jgi:hypothetical protein